MLNIIKKLMPGWVKSLYHYSLAIMAGLVYSCPQDKIQIIGVTGTDGKTTTTYMLDAILRANGSKVALLNGIEFKIGDKVWPNSTDNSTPSPFVIHKFLKQAIQAGCTHVIFEVTSWALSQSRVRGIMFDTAILTNVTHEHLDLHHTLDNYKNAKGQLFMQVGQTKSKFSHKHTTTVINHDDEHYAYFESFQADSQLEYSLKPTDADIYPENIEYLANQTRCNVKSPQGDFSLIVGLPGEFNLYNALAAVCASLSLGVKIESIKVGLKDLKFIPGRVNYIEAGQPFKVIVDFAHTPNAFEKLFASMKKIYPEGKLMAVFGSAGGRDKIKRADQGVIAAKYLDYFVLTTDDPRHEDPRIIADQILSKLDINEVKAERDYDFIKDRAEAIKHAFTKAKPGDVVMLLSMGAYEHMYVGDGKIKWNDTQAALQALSELGYK